MRRRAASDLESALSRSARAWAGKSIAASTLEASADEPIWVLEPDSNAPGGYAFRIQDGPGAPEREPTPTEMAEYQMAIGF
ncbi:hypothetical protein [Geopseudomonas aromaticivorans]